MWNPSRLDLQGETPPVPEAIEGHDEDHGPAQDRSDRGEAMLALWKRLLEHACEKSELHANISPGRYNWIGTRRHGHWWNYVATMNECRVELFINGREDLSSKEIFDALLSQRAEIESTFGEALTWQRLDDKRGSRICFPVQGGWVNTEDWPRIVVELVDAMQRLHKALSGRVSSL